MVILREVYQRAKTALCENQIENYAFEAKELFRKAFGIEPVYFDMDSYADDDECRFLDTLIKRRISGEPLQYILEEWEFYSLPIKVGKGVLIPRQDTEMLVDKAIDMYKHKRDITVIDLCSGSGCIGLALEKNLNIQKTVLVEKSPDALKYLRQNAALNNSKAVIVEGDVLDERLSERLPNADLIVSNPPYLTSEDMKNLQKEVKFEPETALFGGDDGLEFYKNISNLYKDKLNAGGHLMFEIGINQENGVSDILISCGYTNIRVEKDLRGVNRVVIGEKSYE